MLASSEAMYDFYSALVTMARSGKPIVEPPAHPEHTDTSPTMVDLSFPDSPLLGCHGAPANGGGPRPGCRFPARTRLAGCQHHLLIYRQSNGCERALCADRWPGVLEILVGETICPPELAGVAPQGAVLVRPDGYIGFQAQTWMNEAQDTFVDHFSQQFAPARAH